MVMTMTSVKGKEPAFEERQRLADDLFGSFDEEVGSRAYPMKHHHFLPPYLVII
jgi:hypothetical protein